MNEDLKGQADELFSKLGMNLSTAMNLFLRSAVRYGGIPFNLQISRKPHSLEGMSMLEIDEKLAEGLKSMRAGRGRPVSEVFDEIK
jgi:DNA-damage-inducible protein J